MGGIFRAVVAEAASTPCDQHRAAGAEEIPAVVAVDPLATVGLPPHAERHPLGKVGGAAVHAVRVPVVVGKRTIVVLARGTRPVDGQARRALSGAVDGVAVAGVEGGAGLLVHHDWNPFAHWAAVEAVHGGAILAIVVASSCASSCCELVVSTGDHLTPIRGACF